MNRCKCGRKDEYTPIGTTRSCGDCYNVSEKCWLNFCNHPRVKRISYETDAYCQHHKEKFKNFRSNHPVFVKSYQ